MNSESVKLITNNSMIDGTEFKPQDLVRLKQFSDIQKIISCNQQMESISRQIIDKKIKFEQQNKFITKR